MKTLNQLLIIIFSLILLSSNCKKDNQGPVDELSKLPPVTQKGARTFGCLLNGTAFLPHSDIFESKLNSYVNYNYLTVSAGDNNSFYIGVQIDSLVVTAGKTYAFKAAATGNAYAYYLTGTSVWTGSYYLYTSNDYNTTNIVSGQLAITRYDSGICSGTFWFDAVNTKSDTIHVRSGRFDVLVN